MSEHVDILTPETSNCPSFLADDTVLYVNISMPAAPVPLISGDFSHIKFHNGDSFEVLSLGFFIPERFVLYDPKTAGGAFCPSIIMALFAHKMVSAVDAPLVQFGNRGLLKIPFPNYETAVGVFVDSAASIGEDYYLSMQCPYNDGTNVWRISMTGIPHSLAGISFHIVPFIKILHNFPLF